MWWWCAFLTDNNTTLRLHWVTFVVTTRPVVKKKFGGGKFFSNFLSHFIARTTFAPIKVRVICGARPLDTLASRLTESVLEAQPPRQLKNVT